MRILYIGDVMGEAGRKVVADILPKLKKDRQINFVVLQAENINNNGGGPRPQDLSEMQSAGADFFTGGNHSFSSKETDLLYENPDIRLTRPANSSKEKGSGYQIIEFEGKNILIATILGQTVGNQMIETTNPLDKMDEILEKEKDNFDISIVNFHGDFSSEKRVFGYYLDGRVSLVVGDHWHVPTADAMILPGGTGHITDVGMCGSLHSSLGVKTDIIIDRWKKKKNSKNEMELKGVMQFNALLANINSETGFPSQIEHISQIIE